MLLAADDATLLGLHQILLGQATGRMLCRSVVDLGLRADRGDLATAHHVVATRVVAASAAVATVAVHSTFHAQNL